MKNQYRKLLIVFEIAFLVVVLCSCGKPEVAAFQAYGIFPDSNLPQDIFYSLPGPAQSVSPVYMQPITPGVLTQVAANFLYVGTNANYDTKVSSFKPQKAGLYYVDEQVIFEGTYNTQTVKFLVQLNFNNNAYLWYSNDTEVPEKKLNRQKIQINALMCFNGTTDHSEAFVSVTGNVQSVNVVSQESQFEGYYVGPCEK